MIRKMIEQRIGQVSDQQMNKILERTSNHVWHYSQHEKLKHRLSEVLMIAECIFRAIQFEEYEEKRQKNSDPIERTH